MGNFIIGLKIGWKTLERDVNEERMYSSPPERFFSEELRNLTNAQLFFINDAQAFCRRKPNHYEWMNSMINDNHAPHRYRVDGLVP